MEEDDFISKTRRKRQMAELQETGEALVKLSREQLARMPLPEELLEAILECKRISGHEALRRQMQYIGKIMRRIDPEPIQAHLAALQAPSRKDTALFHLAEKWRQDLLDDPEALGRFVHEFPQADAARLRGLVEGARAERQAEKTPRRFRELFHEINAVVHGQARRT